QRDGAVVHELACLGARGAEAHAIDHVVQARFEQLDQGLAGIAAPTLGLDEVLAELLFQDAVHALELLLFAKLQAEVRRARARDAAVLAGPGFELALGIQRAAGALEEKVSAFAARKLAFRSNVTCQDASP